MNTIRIPIMLAVLLVGLNLTASAQDQRSAHDDAYAMKTLRIAGTDLEIVRLGIKTGSVWVLREDEWVKLSPPKALPLSVYDCELVPVGKKSWILVLMDTVTGSTYIYASTTKGWRFAGEASE